MNVVIFYNLSKTANIVMSVGYNFAWPSVSLAKIKADDSPVMLITSQASWALSLQVSGAIFKPIGKDWQENLSFTHCYSIINISNVNRHRQDLHLLLYRQDCRWFRDWCDIFNNANVCIYIGELADADMRGRLGSRITMNLNVRILLIYYVGPWLKYVPLALVGCGIPTIFLLFFSWMSELPYYCIMKNNSKAAEESLIWLTRKTDVSQELEITERDVELDNKNKATLKELFTGSGHQNALIIILGFINSQQLSDLNVMVSYYRLIFKEAHTGLSTDLSVIIVGVFQIVASNVSIILMDNAAESHCF